MLRKLKTLDKILLAVFSFIIIFGLVSGFAVNRILTNLLYERSKEQIVSATELIGRTVATEMNAGNFRAAWQMIHLNVGKNNFSDFLLLDSNGTPIISDIQSENSILPIWKNSRGIEDVNDFTRIKSLPRTGSFVSEYIYNNLGNGNGSYSLLFLFSDNEIANAQFKITLYIFSYVFLLIAFLAYLIFFFRAKLIKAIDKVNNGLESIIHGKEYEDEDSVFSEYVQSRQTLEKFTLEFNEAKAKLEDQVKFKIIVDITKQVSHDIRSPLAALKMALEEVENIPEEHRALIRSSVSRINDIANNLLNTDKSSQKESKMEIELLAPLIDSLVSEKRMQFRNNNNVEIITDLNKSYGLFANVNSVELSRVLSNIINNSVEAFSGKGKIVVSLSESKSEVNEKILLEIKDNGKGIPESVLSKLGTAGVTFGKEGTQSGNGLGIFHAKSTIESFGGEFKIESTIGVGTTIKIYLPKLAVPKWFVEAININETLPIYILDDDDSIHKLWAERFSRLHKSIKHFTNGEEFAREISKIKGSDFLCLVDYELLGQNKSGLDIIDELGISKKSILVTSRFDEAEVRTRAHKIGVRFIPKSFAAIIPIVVTSVSDAPLEYVYIDDDEILRLGWERRAKRKNITLLVLSSCEEFKNHVSKIDKSKTKIYIDSSLGEGKMAGEEFAIILHNEGYEQLYIASGYEAKHFAHLPWLNYAGKDCPL